ncbi:hypothetical protein ACFL2Q_03070 [Thermodesulfobacteriota bacterium]
MTQDSILSLLSTAGTVLVPIACIVGTLLLILIVAALSRIGRSITLLSGSVDLLGGELISSRKNGERIRQEAVTTLLDKLDALNRGMEQLNRGVDQYGDLAINIRDFYAALKHFHEGMQNSVIFKKEIDTTLRHLGSTIQAAGRAAENFNPRIDLIQKRQDDILRQMGKMQADLKLLAESLGTLMGDLDLNVQISAASHLEESLTRQLDVADRQTKTLDKLANRLEGLKIKWPWSS